MEESVNHKSFWAGFELAIHWISVKMEPALGQRSTILPLSSCRSGRWMPSGSRDLFTFVGYLGLEHPTGLALLHLMTLTRLLSYKRYFQSRNLSKIFFCKMRVKDSGTSCYSGLESSAGPHDFLASSPFYVIKGILMTSPSCPPEIS